MKSLTELKGNWNETKGKLKQRFAMLTDIKVKSLCSSSFIGFHSPLLPPFLPGIPDPLLFFVLHPV